MQKIIEVIPNPYIALDKDGIPQGVVGAGMPGIFIGAHLDLVATQKTGKQRFYYPADADGKLTKRVIFSADIATAVQAGELLVVDKAAARLCGISDKEFLAPEAALEAEKKKALAYWQAKHEDSNAAVGEIPREPTKRDDEAAAPAVSATKQLTPTVKLTKNTEA